MHAGHKSHDVLKILNGEDYNNYTVEHIIFVARTARIRF